MSDHPFFGVRPMGWLGPDAASDTTATIEWAETAERLGYEVLFVGDRLLSEAHGPSLAVYQAAMTEPFVILAAIGARTSRLKLATLVAVVPFRHPAYMAKLIASVDVVSNGRFVFGAGSGWSEPELKMYGIDPRRRGAQMEEGLRMMQALWRGEAVTDHGEFWDLDGVAVAPVPVQDGGPPIWLGSFAPDDVVTWSGDMTKGQVRALNRIGRIGSGWVPLTYSAGHKRQLSPNQLGRGWEVIVEAAERAGRSDTDIDVIYPHWIAVIRDEAERKACEAGLARFFPGTFEDAKATYLIGTPEEIVERIRAHTAELPRVDGYLFTPINESHEHLAVIAEEVRPLLST